MTNVKNYLEMLNIAEGAAYRGSCPACNAKDTFTATKQMGILKYNCYKLDCTLRGYYHDQLSADDIRKLLYGTEEVVQKEPETMEIPLYVVQPSAEHTKFYDYVARWSLDPRSLLYDLKDERVVFPILHKGRLIDGAGRAVGGKLPKWYRYSGAASYYLRGSSKTLLIVEDCVSAMIANLEVPDLAAMAILGTSLTDKHYEKIAEYDRILVALDPDAAYKTLQYKREIESFTGLPTTAVRLDDDIKYRLDTDLDKLKGLMSWTQNYSYT